MAVAKILLVEDTESLAKLYQAYLVPLGLDIKWVSTGQAALQALEQSNFDVILLDVMLPDINGLDILESIHSQDSLTAQVIVMTAHGTKDLVMKAMRLGASDFLEKPLEADRLRVTVNNAIKITRLSSEVTEIKKKYQPESFCKLVGSSSAMQSVYQIIRNVAPSTATVFITGESGTGKELTAQAVHDCSGRKGQMVALNCAAIPKDLIESEIFGHVKGAFTGATSNRNGAAGQAEGGTLFLDEICEMDLNLQSKLLRFLQTGTFQKVGSDKLEKADVRFVCATNRDPLAEVNAGRFREDLYYRLHVIPIILPALRQREQDVVEIADFLFKKIAKEENKKYQSMDSSCQQALLNYAWPGNIRELENVVRSAVVLNNAEVMSAEMLPSVVTSGQSQAGTRVRFAEQATNTESNSQVVEPVAQAKAPIQTSASYDDLKEVLPLWLNEKLYIEAVIEHCSGNVPQAASLLEVSPSTIYRKMKAWDS